MLKYVGYDIVFREVPDEVTLAVNLSLCPHRCVGCHSPYLQQDAGQELTTEALVGLVRQYEGEVTCVALMGGDGDAKAVTHMCKEIKRAFGDSVRTAWYSGSEKAPDGLDLSSVDYLKLGPYIAARGPLDKPSTNQRLYRLKDGRVSDDITSKFWHPVGTPM